MNNFKGFKVAIKMIGFSLECELRMLEKGPHCTGSTFQPPASELPGRLRINVSSHFGLRVLRVDYEI